MTAFLEDDFAMAEEFQSSLGTAKLEMAYATALHNVDTMLRDETRRGLHVRTLLAEHDRDKLRSQCESAKMELENAEQSHSAVETQLSDATGNIGRLQELLRARQRENESLKAEINSLQNTSGDSAKIQAGKSALVREIATLKPEIAQLRSQNTSQQSTISEKLALERQVNSLEVELQNTKRSLERALLKDSQDGDEEGGEDVRLEQLNKQFLIEKEERARIEKEASDGARHRKSLESKINALEAKLEGATEQLTQAQDRLRHQVESRSSGQRVQFVAEDAGRPQKPMQFDPGMVIATPGGVKAASKTQKSLALPGDKSSFSITPLLNRTSRNSASQEVSFGDEDDESSDSPEHSPRSRGKATENTAKGRGKIDAASKVAPETNASDSSRPMTNDGKSSSNSSRPLKQRENNEGKSSAFPSTAENGRPPAAKRKNTASNKPAPAGKRDRTLFDEDEEPGDRRQNRKAAAAQSFDGQSRQTEGLRPIRRLGATANLGPGSGFSPLKRNTRAI